VSLYLVPPSVASSSEGAAEGAVPGGGALMVARSSEAQEAPRAVHPGHAAPAGPRATFKLKVLASTCDARKAGGCFTG